MTRKVRAVALVVMLFVLYAYGAFWLSERIPYVHSVLMPYSNRWVSSVVVLGGLGGYFLRPRNRVMSRLWHTLLAMYGVAMAWWFFIYVTGGI